MAEKAPSKDIQKIMNSVVESVLSDVKESLTGEGSTIPTSIWEKLKSKNKNADRILENAFKKIQDCIKQKIKEKAEKKLYDAGKTKVEKLFGKGSVFSRLLTIGEDEDATVKKVFKEAIDALRDTTVDILKTAKTVISTEVIKNCVEAVQKDIKKIDKSGELSNQFKKSFENVVSRHIEHEIKNKENLIDRSEIASVLEPHVKEGSAIANYLSHITKKADIENVKEDVNRLNLRINKDVDRLESRIDEIKNTLVDVKSMVLELKNNSNAEMERINVKFDKIDNTLKRYENYMLFLQDQITTLRDTLNIGAGTKQQINVNNVNIDKIKQKVNEIDKINQKVTELEENIKNIIDKIKDDPDIKKLIEDNKELNKRMKSVEERLDKIENAKPQPTQKTIKLRYKFLIVGVMIAITIGLAAITAKLTKVSFKDVVTLKTSKIIESKSDSGIAFYIMFIVSLFVTILITGFTIARIIALYLKARKNPNEYKIKF